mgnify:CR=1 FL=1
MTPEGQALTVTTVTAEVHQYGGWVPLTDMVQMTTIDNNVVQATSVLASQSGRTMDTIVRDILAGGTNVIYAPKVSDGVETPVSSRAGLDATAQLTVDLIEQAVAQLKVQNADPIGSAGGSYVCIIHPYTAYDLKKDPAGWRPTSTPAPRRSLRRDRQDRQRALCGDQRGKDLDGHRLPQRPCGVWNPGAGCPRLRHHRAGRRRPAAHCEAAGYGDDPLNQRASVGWKAREDRRAPERAVHGAH